MSQARIQLTVLFEDPFWIGLCERDINGKYEACKITFGAEPKDQEVYQFVLDNWYTLRFTPAINGATYIDRKINPKRIHREAQKILENTGIGTKAQQALKLQQEEGKTERKERSKAMREAEEQRQFELQQSKRKEKQKGH